MARKPKAGAGEPARPEPVAEAIPARNPLLIFAANLFKLFVYFFGENAIKEWRKVARLPKQKQGRPTGPANPELDADLLEIYHRVLERRPDKRKKIPGLVARVWVEGETPNATRREKSEIARKRRNIERRLRRLLNDKAPAD